MTTGVPSFTLTVDQNQHLATGDRTVHAVLEISASVGDDEPQDAVPEAAEVIVIDRSSSMSGRRIEQARRAAVAAVDALRDGVWFAVVTGQSHAQVAYPPQGRLVRADRATRAAARSAVDAIRTDGGTRMSTWLTLTARLFEDCPARLRHAVLLTDGHNIEGSRQLARALRECEGRFVCDCRGVGEQWSMEQVKEIAGTLLGTWRPITAPEDLADDFRAVTEASMRKRVTDVRLRFGRSRGSVAYFGRTLPNVEDLTDRGVPVDGGKALEFPLGAWGNEERAYEIRIDITQDALKIEKDVRGKAGTVEVVVPGPAGDEVAARGALFVQWTDDAALSGRVNEKVADYSGQGELARTVNRAIRAWEEESGEATALLGRAVQLAHELGRDDVLERLARIVEIDDPAAGRVRPLRRADVPRSELYVSSWLSEQSRPLSDGPGSSER